ncbi:MAG: response regulator [Proteobacteria bacterium]|nr:response regulator [Pseudomonadota bacterium]
MGHSLLLVDDEEDLLTTMQVLLEEDYSVLTAQSGREALKLLEHQSVDMIISDQRMPGMTGVDLLTQVCELYPSIVRILVTGYADADATVKAINEGRVYRYINKPWGIDDMCLVIRQGLEWRELLTTKGVLNAELSVAHESLAQRNRELKAMQAEMSENAHKAGMADMASVVMHNVSNILNSVVVSGQCMVHLTQASRISPLVKANNLLRQNMDNIEDFIANDPLGKKLLHFYLSFETSLKKENEQISEDSNRLLEMVDAILQVIVMQQSYAMRGSNPEKLSVAEIIDNAIAMQKNTFIQQGIVVEKNFEKVPLVKIQRTKIIHIFFNLVKNASEAMENNEPGSRIIKFVITNDKKYVYVKMSDNGCGINPDNLTQIFSNGFSTKEKGFGFGLASCTHYMHEMNGDIWVESPGINMGATFIMKLPIPV